MAESSGATSTWRPVRGAWTGRSPRRGRRGKWSRDRIRRDLPEGVPALRPVVDPAPRGWFGRGPLPRVDVDLAGASGASRSSTRPPSRETSGPTASVSSGTGTPLSPYVSSFSREWLPPSARPLVGRLPHQIPQHSVLKRPRGGAVGSWIPAQRASRCTLQAASPALTSSPSRGSPTASPNYPMALWLGHVPPGHPCARRLSIAAGRFPGVGWGITPASAALSPGEIETWQSTGGPR